MNDYVTRLIDRRIKHLENQEIVTKKTISHIESELNEQEKILKGIQQEIEALKK